MLAPQNPSLNIVRGRKKLTRPSDGSRNLPVLDIHPGEVKVLVRVGVPVARQLQHAEVPVGAVRRRRGRDGGDLLDEVGVVLGVPEADGAGVEVLDFVLVYLIFVGYFN